jgi:hypothetical protein
MPQRNGFARTNIAGVQFVHNRGIAGVSICLKNYSKLPRLDWSSPQNRCLKLNTTTLALKLEESQEYLPKELFRGWY